MIRGRLETIPAIYLCERKEEQFSDVRLHIDKSQYDKYDNSNAWTTEKMPDSETEINYSSNSAIGHHSMKLSMLP